MLKIIIFILLILIMLLIAFLVYRKKYYEKLYRLQIYKERQKSSEGYIISDEVKLKDILRIPSYEKTKILERLIEYSQSIKKINPQIKEEIVEIIKEKTKDTRLANQVKKCKTKKELVSTLKNGNHKINKEKNKYTKNKTKKEYTEKPKEKQPSIETTNVKNKGNELKESEEEVEKVKEKNIKEKKSLKKEEIKYEKSDTKEEKPDIPLPNDNTIKSVKEIIEFLKKIEEKTFKYYLEKDTKHLLVWLRDITDINYKTELSKIKTKEDLIKLLKENLMESLKEEYIEIKKKISELRKKGKDVKIIDIKSINIPSKIQLAEATLEEKDVEKSKSMIKEIKESLEKMEK